MNGQFWVKFWGQDNKVAFMAGVYIGHLTKRRLLIGRILLAKFCSCQKASMSLTDAGKESQQDASSPGDSWSIPSIIFNPGDRTQDCRRN